MTDGHCAEILDIVGECKRLSGLLGAAAAMICQLEEQLGDAEKEH